MIGVQNEQRVYSAQAGDSCNSEKRRRYDSIMPPFSKDGGGPPPRAKDDTPSAATEVMDRKMSDMELMIQKVRRENNRKYEDYKQTIDTLFSRCGRLESVFSDMKKEVMLEIKALEVISGVIRAEKAKEGSDM